jgi:hypothetical protein
VTATREPPPRYDHWPDTEHLGLERGHRTLTITRKGGKVVTIPLAPRTEAGTFAGYYGHRV